MTKLLLVLLALLPAVAYSHRDHHAHSQAQGLHSHAINAVQWQSSLQRFSATGDPADLETARSALRQRQQASALTAIEDLYLAAWTSQADHRFLEARAYADQIATSAPGWAPVQLLSAGLYLVRGEYAAARAECAAMRGVAVAVRLGCLAQSLPAPSPERYQSLVDSLQAASAELAEAKDLQAWLALTAGDLAVRASRLADAATHYRVALRLQPSMRGRVALAQTLLDLNQPAAAITLLPKGSPALAIRVKRLVATRRLSGLNAADQDLEAQLERQFTLWQQQGDVTHGREMAEFYLHLKDRPARALNILEASLARQREYEDERLLREARLALLTRRHQQLHTSGRGLARSLAYTGG